LLHVMKTFDGARFPLADEALLIQVEDIAHPLQALRYVADARNSYVGPESMPTNVRRNRTRTPVAAVRPGFVHGPGPRLRGRQPGVASCGEADVSSVPKLAIINRGTVSTCSHATKGPRPLDQSLIVSRSGTAKTDASPSLLMQWCWDTVCVGSEG
jgi:hypothetical protein